LVDLGASHALILDEHSSENLNKPEKTLRGTIGHGLGGEIKGEIGRIKRFGIGPFECNNVLASFPDSAYYQGNIELVERNGTIGGEILSRFNVIFNYLDSSFHFSKGIKFKNPFEHNMSGMEYRLIGQELDRLLVINVKENSPAGLAGIQVGDQVIKINRHKVGSSTFSHIGDLLRSKEGKKMNVKFIRGLQLIDVSFKLERQI
jgi:membrane-associated protease RseP (regulator of RpoE activity)